MNFELYTKVALKGDLNEYGLKNGDVAVVVEKHAEINGQIGFTLEVFNALGETIAVPTVNESQIELLTSNEIFHIRSFDVAKVAEPTGKYFS
ncbi:MAG: DUF4926 domain-containing protein [Ignavibacteriaceae bacterium]|nr:DUF4926 domain-containing protein [Ignavibacteriaceae bacterium]